MYVFSVDFPSFKMMVTTIKKSIFIKKCIYKLLNIPVLCYYGDDIELWRFL
jgi:hypothetical protein